jgi:hypothetical protein
LFHLVSRQVRYLVLKATWRCLPSHSMSWDEMKWTTRGTWETKPDPYNIVHIVHHKTSSQTYSRCPTFSRTNNGKVQQPAHVGTFDELACFIMNREQEKVDPLFLGGNICSVSRQKETTI